MAVLREADPPLQVGGQDQRQGVPQVQAHQAEGAVTALIGKVGESAPGQVRDRCEQHQVARDKSVRRRPKN